MVLDSIQAATKFLRELMSEVSQDCWCAGWMIGTERVLFDIVFVDSSRTWGLAPVDPKKVDLMREVATFWDIWVVSHEESDPAIPLAQARSLFAKQAVVEDAIHAGPFVGTDAYVERNRDPLAAHQAQLEELKKEFAGCVENARRLLGETVADGDLDREAMHAYFEKWIDSLCRLGLEAGDEQYISFTVGRKRDKLVWRARAGSRKPGAE